MVIRKPKLDKLNWCGARGTVELVLEERTEIYRNLVTRILYPMKKSDSTKLLNSGIISDYVHYISDSEDLAKFYKSISTSVNLSFTNIEEDYRWIFVHIMYVMSKLKTTPGDDYLKILQGNIVKEFGREIQLADRSLYDELFAKILCRVFRPSFQKAFNITSLKNNMTDSAFEHEVRLSVVIWIKLF